MLIERIRCHLETPAGRRAMREVLRRVQDRCPRDFRRLQALVVGVFPLSDDDATDGTAGEWKPLYPSADDPATWGYGLDDTPGNAFVCERGHTEREMVALLAHEFGHACTTEEDRRRRNCPDEEWASEAAADWYAYKWGFGRDIARGRASRQWGHHGITPGSACSFDFGGVRLNYRMSRKFVFRLTSKRRIKRGN